MDNYLTWILIGLFVVGLVTAAVTRGIEIGPVRAVGPESSFNRDRLLELIDQSLEDARVISQNVVPLSTVPEWEQALLPPGWPGASVLITTLTSKGPLTNLQLQTFIPSPLLAEGWNILPKPFSYAAEFSDDSRFQPNEVLVDEQMDGLNGNEVTLSTWLAGYSVARLSERVTGVQTGEGGGD